MRISLLHFHGEQLLIDIARPSNHQLTNVGDFSN